MNTLSKAHTRLWFASAEEYAALESRWSKLTNSDAHRNLGPEHHLLYAVLRGKDYRKAFAPVTNARKLENGGFYKWGLVHALRSVLGTLGEAATHTLLQPFEGVVSAAMLAHVRQVLPVKRYWIEPKDLEHNYFVPPDLLAQVDLLSQTDAAHKAA